MAIYQQKVARYYNLRVKGKLFWPSDLVLRKTEASQSGELGKLSPNWEGPYQVVEAVQSGTYKLEHLDDTSIPRTWNSESLCIYYQ